LRLIRTRARLSFLVPLSAIRRRCSASAQELVAQLGAQLGAQQTAQLAAQLAAPGGIIEKGQTASVCILPIPSGALCLGGISGFC